MKEVCQVLRTSTASRKRREQNVQECSNEAEGPGYEDEDNEPQNGPTPAAIHDGSG